MRNATSVQFARRKGEIPPRLFGGHGLLEEPDLAARVVGHRKDLVELDLRLHAVALHDAVEPRSGIERLGVLDALPLVHPPAQPLSLQMKCLLISPFTSRNPGAIL